MPETLINGTGSDRISLWFMRDGKIKKTLNQNRSWLFVTGDRFDLERLESDLSFSGYIRTQFSEEKTMHGIVTGLKIFSKPSKFRDIVSIVSCIGYSRKFRIYNSDINPVLRYVSLMDLRFLGIGDLMLQPLLDLLLFFIGPRAPTEVSYDRPDHEKQCPDRKGLCDCHGF